MVGSIRSSAEGGSERHFIPGFRRPSFSTRRAPAASRSAVIPAPSLAWRSAGSVRTTPVYRSRCLPGTKCQAGLQRARDICAMQIPPSHPVRGPRPACPTTVRSSVPRGNRVGTQFRCAPAVFGRANAVQHGRHAHRIVGAGCVECAETARFDQPDHPFGQIASVDELHGIAAIAWRKHFAAARQANRPIGKRSV